MSKHSFFGFSLQIGGKSNTSLPPAIRKGAFALSVDGIPEQDYPLPNVKAQGILLGQVPGASYRTRTGRDGCVSMGKWTAPTHVNSCRLAFCTVTEEDEESGNPFSRDICHLADR